MVWHGMVEVCEGAPVAVSGWVLTDRHDLIMIRATLCRRDTILFVIFGQMFFSC